MKLRVSLSLLAVCAAGVMGCRTPAPPSVAREAFSQPPRQSGPAARQPANQYAIPRTEAASPKLGGTTALPAVTEPTTKPQSELARTPVEETAPAPLEALTAQGSPDGHEPPAQSAETTQSPPVIEPVILLSTASQRPHSPAKSLALNVAQPAEVGGNVLPESIRLLPPPAVVITAPATPNAVNIQARPFPSTEQPRTPQSLAVDEWLASAEKAAAARAERVAEQQAEAEAIRRGQRDLSDAFRRWLGVTEPATP